MLTARNPKENPNAEALLQKMASKLQAVKNQPAPTSRHSGKQISAQVTASVGGQRPQEFKTDRENSTKKLKIRIQELVTSQSSKVARRDTARSQMRDAANAGSPSPKGHRPETVTDSAASQYFLSTIQGLPHGVEKRALSLTRKPMLSPNREERRSEAGGAVR